MRPHAPTLQECTGMTTGPDAESHERATHPRAGGRAHKKQDDEREQDVVKCEPKRNQWVRKDAPGLPLSPQMYPGGCHERGTRR